MSTTTMNMYHYFDFYFLEAMRAGMSMAKSSSPEIEFRHSFERLERDVNTAFDELSDAMAQHIHLYMWGAGLGEARHANRCGLNCSFGFQNLSSDRGTVFKKAMQYEPTQENVDHLIACFEQKGWTGSYGGKKWAAIARAIDMYGKVSNATFIDHAADLEHNGGCVFNKHEGKYLFLEQNGMYYFTEFLDEKFSKDILRDGIRAEVAQRTKSLLERYNNIVHPVNIGAISGSGEWLVRADFTWGDEELTWSENTYKNKSFACASCGTELVRGEEYSDHDGDPVCEQCCLEYSVTCEHCDDFVSTDDAVTVGGKTICEYCANTYFKQCYGCDEHFRDDDVTYIDDIEEFFCEACIDQYTAGTCDNCGDMKYYRLHEVADIDEYWCKSCIDDDAEHCTECDEYYEDLSSHTMEEHFKPIGLNDDADGVFEADFEPIEPIARTITEMKIAIDGGTIKDVEMFQIGHLAGAVYYKGGKAVRGIIHVPTGRSINPGHYDPTWLNMYKMIVAVKDMVDWNFTDMAQWEAVPADLKDAMKKKMMEAIQ